ncbi:MAG: ABC transporter substrate-binding protein [Candidatus Nanoarchaeia archaeon]
MRRIILAIALLILAGCNLTGAAVVDDTIKIGAIYMMSGTEASYGEHSLAGANMALDKINKEGINGKKLEIIVEDNHGDNPKAAVSAFHKLVAEGTNIILGPNWSPSGLALAPLACETKTIMISPTLGVQGFHEQCGYTFNLHTIDRELSKQFGEYLYEEGYRRISIIGSVQVWEDEQAEAVKIGFEGKGGEVINYVLAEALDKDLRPEALKLTQDNPEAIVLANYNMQHITEKRVRELGSTAPFYSVLMTQTKIDAADGALEDTIVVSAFTPTDDFVEEYVEITDKQPEEGADTSYDTIMLLAQAMRETNSEDPKVISEYLSKLKTYNGTSGHLTFIGDGSMKKQTKIKIVKDGKLQDL